MPLTFVAMISRQLISDISGSHSAGGATLFCAIDEN